MKSAESTDFVRARAQAVARPTGMPGIGKAKSLFLLAAGLSFVMSVTLYFTGSYQQGIYVGLWVPSILSAGALLLGSNGHE